MTRTRRRLPVALVLAAALLVAPAGASAANRYASPAGTASDPCSDSSDPCPIEVAINQATSGDDVTLLGGVPPATPFTSSVSLGLTCTPGCSLIAGITVHGAPGARPVVNFATTPGLDGFDVGAGSTLRDVEATTSSEQINLVEAIGGTVERVSAHSSGTGDDNYACVAGSGAVYRDTVCSFSGPAASNQSNSALAAFSQVANDTVALRNVTIFASSANGLNAVSSNGHSIAVTATNVIARGGAADVRTSDFGSGPAQTVTLDHSNYATAVEQDLGDITDAGTGTNETTAPAFVNATTGDFHETPTSVGTLDLGTATGLLAGELDVVGLDRTHGSAPDIGAYEFFPPAPTVTPPATTPPATPPKKKKCKKHKRRAAAAKKCKKKK